MPDMPEIMSKTAIFVRLEDVLNDPSRRRELYAKLTQTGPVIPVQDCGDGIPSLLWQNTLSDIQKDHLKDDWFTNWWQDVQAKGPGGTGGVEESVRRGLVRLIERVGLRCCPWIDCYWACAYQHDHTCAHPIGEDSRLPDQEAMAQIDPELLEEMTPEQRKAVEQALRYPREDKKCPPSRDVICTISWSPVQVTFIVHTPPPDVPTDQQYAEIPPWAAMPEPIQVVKHINAGTDLQPNWQIKDDIIAQRRAYGAVPPP